MKRHIFSQIFFLIALAAAFLSSSLSAAPTSAASFPREIKRDFFLERARDVNQPYNIRISAYDSIPEVEKDTRLAIEKGLLLEDAGLYANALRLYEQHEYNVTPDSLPLYLKLQLRRATAEFFTGNLNETIRRCRMITDTRKPDSLLYNSIDAERLMAHLFMDGENLDIPKRHLERALKLYEKFEKSSAPKSLKELTLGKIHYSLSSQALGERDFARAFDEVKKMRDLLRPYWPDTHTNVNIAVIYHIQGELNMAEKFYRETLASSDRQLNFFTSLNNFLELLLSQDRIPEALDIIERYKDDLQQLKDPDILASFHDLKYRLFLATGDSTMALKQLGENFDELNELKQRTSQLYLGALAEKYEGETTADGGKLRSDNRRLSVALWIAGTALLLLIGGVAFYISRCRKLKKKCESAEQRLLSLEDNMLAEKKRSEGSDDKINRQMLEMTLHMTQLTTALNHIEAIANREGEQGPEMVGAIRNELEKLSRGDHVWDMFMIYFEQVNQRFFETLFRICPTLTKTELRMCAFIRSGMNTKEIASATNRSIRTVDCIKYNLRKKLDISEPTEDFLRKISAET